MQGQSLVDILIFLTAGARTLHLTGKRPTWSTTTHNLKRRLLDVEPGYPPARALVLD